MSYIGKLSPTVGNGLGGLPERGCETTTTNAVIIPDKMLGLGNPKVEYTFSYGTNPTYHIILPFGNKVCSLVIDTTNDTNYYRYIYEYNSFNKSFSLVSAKTATTIPKTAEIIKHRPVFPIFDNYCMVYQNITNGLMIPSIIRLNEDNTLTFLGTSSWFSPNGTYSSGVAYVGMDRILYSEKIGDSLFVFAASSTTPSSNGIFVFNSSMNLINSYQTDLACSYLTQERSNFMFTKTSYGYCVAVNDGASTGQNRTYNLYLKTFSNNFTLIESKTITKSFISNSYTGTYYLCKTIDGLGIGLAIYSTQTTSDTGRVSYSGICPLINSDGTFSNSVTYVSETPYLGVSSAQYMTLPSCFRVFSIEGYMYTPSDYDYGFPSLASIKMKNISPNGVRPYIDINLVPNCYSLYSNSIYELPIKFSKELFLAVSPSNQTVTSFEPLR